uniref:Uncharacterized protein n=1 Tax=Mycena chlorophos TaxID=658473 RepID=A0ABQ0LCH5_MYCCL|nr:predicted protein [Mycena chlorophos]
MSLLRALLLLVLLVLPNPISGTGVSLTFFFGANCSGPIVATSSGSAPGDCLYLADSGSAKSVQYAGVPNEIHFFESGGPHDQCNGLPSSVVRAPAGDGCSNAVAGYNWESALLT